MRFYHDAEFREDGKTIDLISYAILAETGESLYAINQDADWDRITEHRWLNDNVMPHLPGRWRYDAERDREVWRPDASNPLVMSRPRIAAALTEFVSSYGPDRDEHELWAWYGAYDHVAMAQLFGPMIALPACLPMHTNDLKTLVGMRQVPAHLHGKNEHDALADCHFDRRVYEWVQATKALPRSWSEGTVTLPRDVFVGLYERYSSQGPNDGISDEDESVCEELWRRFF